MSDLINIKKNHHFISQVEQRWNASSDFSDTSKARICRYKILDKNIFKLEATNRPLIKLTSAKDDLFTLELFDSGTRLNLEKFFGVFEDKYNRIVSSFHSSVMYKIESAKDLSKRIDAADLLSEIKYLQKIKFLNYIRNPHNIRNSLKYFSFCKDHIIRGTGPDFEAILNAINKSDKDQRKMYLCEIYNVTPAEFDSWIKLIIFFVYFDDENSVSTLDGMIDQYFKANELSTTVIISFYTDDTLCPLLPDTGSTIYPDLSYRFNVSKHCFVYLHHLQIDSDYAEELAKKACEESHKPYTDEMLSLFKEKLARNFRLSLYVNNKDLLARHNKSCITESVNYVYAASPIVVGAEVIKKAR